MSSYDEITHDKRDELYGPTRRRVHPSAQDVQTVEESVTTEPTASTLLEAPPRAGAGSGRDEWATYAASLGLEVPDELGRDEIIALVEQTKVTEE